MRLRSTADGQKWEEKKTIWLIIADRTQWDSMGKILIETGRRHVVIDFNVVFLMNRINCFKSVTNCQLLFKIPLLSVCAQHSRSWNVVILNLKLNDAHTHTNTHRTPVLHRWRSRNFVGARYSFCGCCNRREVREQVQQVAGTKSSQSNIHAHYSIRCTVVRTYGPRQNNKINNLNDEKSKLPKRRPTKFSITCSSWETIPTSD